MRSFVKHVDGVKKRAVGVILPVRTSRIPEDSALHTLALSSEKTGLMSPGKEGEQLNFSVFPSPALSQHQACAP